MTNKVKAVTWGATSVPDWASQVNYSSPTNFKTEYTKEDWLEYLTQLEQDYPEAKAALELRSTKLYKALK